MSEVFVSTDARRACPRGVIVSTMDVFPRGTCSNLVEGNGHFFPSCCQLYLSSFSDTHTNTHVPPITRNPAPTLIVPRSIGCLMMSW